MCFGVFLATLTTVLAAPLDRRERSLFTLVVTVVVLRVQNRSANAKADGADLLKVEDATRQSENATGHSLAIEFTGRTDERNLGGVAERVVGCDELVGRDAHLREDVVAGSVLGPPRELTRSVRRIGLHPAEVLVDDVQRLVVLVGQARSKRTRRVDESRREVDVDLTRHLRDGHVTEDEVEDVLEHAALVTAVVDAAHPRVRARRKQTVAGLRSLDVVHVVIVRERRVDLDVSRRTYELLERLDHELAVRTGQMGIRELLVTDGVTRRNAAVDEEVDVGRLREIVLVTRHTEEVVGRESATDDHMGLGQHLDEGIQRQVKGSKLTLEGRKLGNRAVVAEGSREGHFGRKEGCRKCRMEGAAVEHTDPITL